MVPCAALKQTEGRTEVTEGTSRAGTGSRREEAPDLLDLTPEEFDVRLGEHFRARGEPAFRVGQVRRWVHETGVPAFAGMTDLPAREREGLEASFRLTAPAIHSLSRSNDGTAKHLWRLAGGDLVESVLIPARDRLTLCLSSQAGCAMGCTFCATGWAGFTRQLSTGEIVAQYRASRSWAEEEGYGPITNIVYMGMGEPLANRRAVLASLTILNRAFGVGARRITVSTVGVIPEILELARRPEQFGLALSLHAPNPELRRTLIPLEERYPLPELMEAVRSFREGKGRRVTFEYTMIAGVNDDASLAPELARLALEVGAFVNLIPYNPIPWQDWEPSPRRRQEHFLTVLETAGVAAAIREPRGRDIEAACGQLRAAAHPGGSAGRTIRPPSADRAPDPVPAHLAQEGEGPG